MMSADDFRELVAAGLTSEQIALVMQFMERDSKALREADEARRQKARDRVSKWRERHGNVTEISQNITERLTGEGAHVEDKTSSTVQEPLEEKNNAPAAPSPRKLLEAVISPERASDVIEMRKRIRAPLTARAAQLLAKDLAKWPRPDDAADEMVKRGWRGFDPTWMPGQREGPQRVVPIKDSPANEARRRLEIIQNERSRGSGPDDHQSAAGVIPVNAVRLLG